MVTLKNIKAYFDLSIIIIWFLIGSISIIFFKENIIRTIFGLSIVLFFPGYILTLVCYPKKKDLGNIERLAIGLGMSIVIVPILGLILNFSIGLRLMTIYLSIIIYSIPMIMLAFYRRNKLNEDEIFFIDIIGYIKPKNIKIDILGIILILSIIAAIVFVSYVIITPKIGDRFTEFYVLDEEKTANNYSKVLEIGRVNKYFIGISNHEYTYVNYTIKVSLDDEILTTKEINIGNNEKWEDNIEIIPAKEGKRLEFLLYKENDFSIPYRKLNLWMR